VGIPPTANLVSVRNTPPLYGMALIDAIPDAAILAGQSDRGNGVKGRANIITVADGTTRVGRFGWKAQTASLETFVADAMLNEHGVTNPIFRHDAVPSSAGRCATLAKSKGLEDNGAQLKMLNAFVASLEPYASDAKPGSGHARGETKFEQIGCAACHTPSFKVSDREVRLYSDLLLHDVGPALADGVVQGQALSGDWRTTPLWGLAQRKRLLHDGRARTPEEAVVAHDGEARHSSRAYLKLTAEEKSELLAFLLSL
jgi:CxxC motif-containing protein (DUF1111 family)